MITLYKEYSIGIKKLSDAELARESSPSDQTHIGLSEKVFTFLPNTPTQIDGVLVFNKSCTFVECAFSKIGNQRSTKIDSQTPNPVKSVVKQIRNIASNASVSWYLIWFAFENQMPVFWLISSNSDDYSDMQGILSGIESLTVIKAAKEEYFVILEQVRKIKKLFALVESKTKINETNRLIASTHEHRTFVHLTLDYFRSLGNLDLMVPYFSTKAQNAPITVSKENSFKLLNMFIFAADDELEKRNSTLQGRRWYTDPFIVEGRKLYLYVDWFPGKDKKGKDTQLMIPDFVKFVKDCFGPKYVYQNAQGTHELWEINDPESHLAESSDHDTEIPNSVMEDVDTINNNTENNLVSFINTAQQIIHYGAPGTGKSHTIDIRVTEENSIRTTFHPDSDYSTFVGAYKPKMDGEKIVYKFQPQAFLKAYCRAWKNSSKSIYLVIEEINRGNCAQIFGDLFQLLDRCKNGFSTYAIEPDSDISDFLLTDKEYTLKNLNFTTDIVHDNGKIIAKADSIKNGQKLVLPPNLSILCTMNTSDQSLFPMDSAFKRRWQWKYTPIEQPKAGEEGEPRKWKLKADGRWCYWWEFLQAINEVIEEVNHSEDKQLGYFFAKPEVGEYIDENTFVNKVVFYLWNDIFKDEECDIFKYKSLKLSDVEEVKINGIKEDTELTFRRFIKNSEEVRGDVVRWFIDNILKEKNITMLDDSKQEPMADKVAYMRPLSILMNVGEDNEGDGEYENNSESEKEFTSIDNCEFSYNEYKPLTKAVINKLGERQYMFFKNGFDTKIAGMPISYARIAVTMAKSKNGQAEVKFYNPAPTGYKNSKELYEFLVGKNAKSVIENIANNQHVEFRVISNDTTKVTGWALRLPVDYNNLDVDSTSEKLYNLINSLLAVSESWINEFLANN